MWYSVILICNKYYHMQYIINYVGVVKGVGGKLGTMVMGLLELWMPETTVWWTIL